MTAPVTAPTSSGHPEYLGSLYCLANVTGLVFQPPAHSLTGKVL